MVRPRGGSTACRHPSTTGLGSAVGRDPRRGRRARDRAAPRSRAGQSRPRCRPATARRATAPPPSPRSPPSAPTTSGGALLGGGAVRAGPAQPRGRDHRGRLRNVAGFSVQDLGPGQSQVAMRGVSAGQIVRNQAGGQGAGRRLPRRVGRLDVAVHARPRPVRHVAGRGAARPAGNPVRVGLAVGNGALHHQPAGPRGHRGNGRARLRLARRQRARQRREARRQRAPGVGGGAPRRRVQHPFPSGSPGPVSPGRWPRSSAGGSCVSPWPGVESPAAVHGVARTAPEAGPGRLVSALRRLGPVPGRAGDNPLVLLGEFDRVGEAAADALLGALDPARNRAFRDRYLWLPLDLIGVLFVRAATGRGQIPPLQRERIEPLPLAGYDDEEKHRIATLHLIRQRLARHGLSSDELSFSPAVLRLLIRGYAQEPGVRLLDDRIDTLCRRAARLRGRRFFTARGDESGDGGPGARRAAVPRPGTRGPAPPARRRPRSGRNSQRRRRRGRRGDAPPRGRVVPRHRDGRAEAHGVGAGRADVVRANAGQFASLQASLDDAFDLLHVQLPRAGRSKDGASAGVTVAAAIVSALTGRPVRGDVAMTGELTLGGQVEPVAGIREKVLAACQSGMATGGPARRKRGRCRRELPRRAAVRHQRALRQHHGRGAHGGVARRR